MNAKDKQRRQARLPRLPDGRIDVSQLAPDEAAKIEERREKQRKYRREKRLREKQEALDKVDGDERDWTELQRQTRPYRWKAGESGNPAGMPEGTITQPKFDSILSGVLGELVRGVDGSTEITRLEYLVRRAVKEAAEGDVHFWREIMDRVSPKPREEGPAAVQAIVQFVFERDDGPEEKRVEATIVETNR